MIGVQLTVIFNHGEKEDNQQTAGFRQARIQSPIAAGHLLCHFGAGVEPDNAMR